MRYCPFLLPFQRSRKTSEKLRVGEESSLTTSIVLPEPTSPSKNAAMAFMFEKKRDFD
jgi:hypothetical protein